MSHTFSSLQILGLLTAASFVSMPAHSEDMSTMVSKCNAVSYCSNQSLGEDGMLFIFGQPAQSKKVLCRNNGDCIKVMPRGQRVLVTNFAEMLSIE